MFKHLAEHIVGSYKTLSLAYNCSFAVVSNDGSESKYWLRMPCHARLEDVHANVYDQIITSYPAEDELDLKFFDFMKNILYKKWSNFFHLEQTEDGKYYIRISNLSEIPANVVFNFCICSRTIIERKETLLVWQKLIDNGVHPSFSYAICRASIGTEHPNLLDNIVSSLGSLSGHIPIDQTASMKRVVIEGPEGCAVSFKEDPESSRPTNCIWGNDKDFRPLIGTSIREFWEKWEKNIK